MELKPYSLYKNTFNSDFLNNLYESDVANSLAIGHDSVNHSWFSENLESEINIILRKVDNKTYKFTQYKEKLISKGANKYPRQISIPTIRDRLTLKYITKLIQLVYSSSLSQEIPQVKIDSIKKKIATGNYDAFVKVDITNFYPSICHDTLIKKLRRKIRKPELLNVIESSLKTPTVSQPDKSIANNNKGVPQGLSISNVLAEIYLLDLDNKMKCKPFYYCRYVDDILILCNKSEVGTIHELISSELEKIGLKTHDMNSGDKCEFGELSSSFSYLGYVFNDTEITVRQASKHRIESSLAKIFTTYKYSKNKIKKIKGKENRKKERKRIKDILEWRLNLRITGCVFNDTKRGWVFYYSQINDLQVLRELDFTVEKLCERFKVSGKIKPKKFIKTYHESKVIDKDSYKYIINFDNFTTQQKRQALTKYLGVKAVSTMHDNVVEKYFGMKISTIIKELELDIGSKS